MWLTFRSASGTAWEVRSRLFWIAFVVLVRQPGCKHFAQILYRQVLTDDLPG